MSHQFPIALAGTVILGLTSPIRAADDVAVHHRHTSAYAHSAPSSPRQIADPPFSFACTTDGGMRVGCR